jgi:hypothetical protein
MIKIDLMKELKDLYAAPLNKVVFKTIPPLHYLMIDGKGDPNTSPLYKESVQALYSIAYTIKFSLKKGAEEIDFKVMPLEGLWWAEDMNLFSVEKKQNWKWTMMILQPKMVSAEIVQKAKSTVIEQKGINLAKQVRFEEFEEKDSVQILHKGSYASETENIRKLHQAIEEQACLRTGKHHEIYFNSPLKTSPENLKTIIRQPFLRK